MAIENERQQKLLELVELREQVARLERELGAEEDVASPDASNLHAKEASLDAMIAAERVSSMANLARGIAHEINNPLSTCLGYLKCAIEQSERLQGAEAIENTLHRLERGVQRIRGVVSELQMLSEEMVGESEKLDLAAVLERVCRLVPPELRSRLDLELEPVWVWVDRPRVYQIAYNMIMPLLLAAQYDGEPDNVLVRVCPAEPGTSADEATALLEVIAASIPSPGTRTDLLSTLRGEYTPTTLPLRLARWLATEVGAQWRENPVSEGKYRTAVIFDAV